MNKIFKDIEDNINDIKKSHDVVGYSQFFNFIMFRDGKPNRYGADIKMYYGINFSDTLNTPFSGNNISSKIQKLLKYLDQVKSIEIGNNIKYINTWKSILLSRNVTEFIISQNLEFICSYPFEGLEPHDLQ